MIPHSAARRWRCDTCLYVTALSVLSELQKPGTAHRNPDAIFKGGHGGGAGRGGWCAFHSVRKVRRASPPLRSSILLPPLVALQDPSGSLYPRQHPPLPRPSHNFEEGGMMSLTTITCSRPAPLAPSFPAPGKSCHRPHDDSPSSTVVPGSGLLLLCCFPPSSPPPFPLHHGAPRRSLCLATITTQVSWPVPSGKWVALEAGWPAGRGRIMPWEREERILVWWGGM